MGTRSLTVFMDGEKELAVLYRHMDGYPKGHGADLKSAFGDCEMVNGIGGSTKHRIANGIDCLAAQVIAHFKKGLGSVYVMAAGTRDVGEEFVYTLSWTAASQSARWRHDVLRYAGHETGEHAGAV